MATAKKQTKKTVTRKTKAKPASQARARTSKATSKTKTRTSTGTVTTKNAKRVGQDSTTPVKKSNAPKKPTPNTVELRPADWKKWRELRFIRLWQAAMLSLNYEPSSRDALKTTNDDEYKKYLHRKKVLFKQFGYHDLVPNVEHHSQGQKITERCITWDNLEAFCSEMKWIELPHDDNNRLGLIEQQQEPSPAVVLDERLLANSQVILFGALLDLFEEVLRRAKLALDDLPYIESQNKNTNKKERAILKGGKDLNISLLAQLMIASIGQHASRDRGFKPDNVQLILRNARAAFTKAKNLRA